MNKKLLTILLSFLLPAFLVSAVVYATTSVGTDISVEGDIDIAGGDLQATTGTLNISKPSSMTTVEGTLNVDEAVTLDLTLVVTATTTLNGNLVMGTSASPLTMTTYANKAIDVWTTSGSTDASNSVTPIYMKSVMTGVGGVGGRSQFEMSTEVVLGGWANALKGYTDFGDAGSVTGLASAVVAEMRMPAKTLAGGNYAPFEAELVFQELSKTGAGTPVSFMYARASEVTGTGGLDDFNATGYLFNLQGLTAGEGSIFEATVKAGVNSTHSLKILIGGTAYYIPLNTSKEF